jgi:hypothetical protein
MRARLTKRIKSVFILSTYFMLLLVPPAIHVNCCTGHHHEDDQFGPASGLHPRKTADEHLSNGNGPPDGAHPALVSPEMSQIVAAHCCGGHQCGSCGDESGNWVLPARNLSTQRCFQSFLCNASVSIDNTMDRGNRLQSRDNPVATTAVASLLTVVLLI